MNVSEAEIAELERLLEAKRTAGIPGTPRETFLYVARDNLRDWLEERAERLLAERRERSKQLGELIGAAKLTMEVSHPDSPFQSGDVSLFAAAKRAIELAAHALIVERAERREREGKLAEAEQRATNWEDDAQRYAQNSDYWKKRAEAAEATLAAVSEHIRRTGYRSCPCNRELREALTTPVVSDRLTPEERKEVESRRSSPTKDWARRLGAVTDDPLLAIIDRLAPVSHQEDK